MEITVYVHDIKRLANSAVGNPRWELLTDHGNYKTKTDASVNYEISEGSVIGKSLFLTLERGQIIDVVVASRRG